MDHGNNCAPDLTGFAGRSEPVASRIFHLWGSISPGGDQSTYLDPTRSAPVANMCRGHDGGVWQITTTAKEYRRLVEEGTALPLLDTAISDVPVGVDPFTRRTVVQLRVYASDGVDEREFEMDANQSITIVAQDVCAYWLGPRGETAGGADDNTGMRDVLNLQGPERNLPRSGMVIDAFLGVSVSRIEQPPGHNSEVLLTKHLFVPEGERGSIAIPAYANRVTIYQEPTLGSSSVMWTQTLGDPNGVSGFMTLAALPFIVGERKTEPEAILPNASHLWSDIDNDADRFFTLVWTIRP